MAERTAFDGAIHRISMAEITAPKVANCHFCYLSLAVCKLVGRPISGITSGGADRPGDTIQRGVTPI